MPFAAPHREETASQGCRQRRTGGGQRHARARPAGSRVPRRAAEARALLRDRTMADPRPASRRAEPPAAPGAPQARQSLQALQYDRVAIALHWMLALALLAQIAFGFLLDDLAPRGTPARSGVINLHKSIGVVIGVLILLRLAWRLSHRPPPWPDAMPPWQRRAAAWGHAALYAVALLLPLTGYLGSNFSRYGLHFFGLPWAPWGPDLPAVRNALTAAHQALALLLTALIAGHVALALRHVAARDGVFRRMLPARDLR